MRRLAFKGREFSSPAEAVREEGFRKGQEKEDAG